METKYLEISDNINLNITDVEKIIKIQNEIITGYEQEYVIAFTECRFLNSAISVLIGTLPVYGQQVNKRVSIWFKYENSKVFEFIKSVGIYDFFNNTNGKYTRKRALPFNRITNEDMMENYTDKILELAPINMSEKANATLSSYLFEIFQNSFSHAHSPIDVFSCGYWMSTQLYFSIYDMGVGIPYNVRQKFNAFMNSTDCVKWAFEEGNTTLDETIIKRGLGLSRLEKFIELNKGKLFMYTDDVYYTNESGKKNIGVLSVPIKGTLIIISIKADNKHRYIVDGGKDV